MYHKIVIGLALNQGVFQAAFAVARALKAEGGSILAVHVYEPPSSTVQNFLNDDTVSKAIELNKDLLAERVAGEDDVEAVLLTGHPGRSLTDYASKIEADCIIVGSHTPGLRDYFLGSTAARVVRHAICSVHVVR